MAKVGFGKCFSGVVFPAFLVAGVKYNDLISLFLPRFLVTLF